MLNHNYKISFMEMDRLAIRAFGKADEHDLAIDITTGAVVMVESGFDDILFNCAQNDASFLAAILNIGVFLLRRVLEGVCLRMTN